MKIILTAMEMNAIRNIMEGAEPGAYAKLQEEVKINPLVKACLINDNEYEVDIDAACMTDCLQAEAGFIGVILPSLKAAYSGYKMMCSKLERIIADHKTRHYHGNIQKAQMSAQAAAVNVTSVVHDLVKQVDRSKVHCFNDLALDTQNTLVRIYGEIVRDMFDSIMRTYG